MDKEECFCLAFAGSMDSPVKPENDNAGGHIGRLHGEMSPRLGNVWAAFGGAMADFRYNSNILPHSS